MTIVITTPTGNTGRQVLERLLAAEANLTLLVRNPDKLDNTVASKVNVLQGSLDDTNFVIQATKDIEALFWVTPNNFITSDLLNWYDRAAQTVAQAVQINAIPYVINLSSGGADIAEGAGSIPGLHRVEQKLNQVAENIIHLRPGFFMENYLMQLNALQANNKIFMPIAGHRRLGMIATRDIAHRAADLLLNRTWRGQSRLGLHGPADISFDEAATTLGQVLGQSITHVQISSDDFRHVLLEQGVSADVAEQYTLLWKTLANDNYVPAEPRTAETTTPTTFAQFVRERIQPLLNTPVVS